MRAKPKYAERSSILTEDGNGTLFVGEPYGDVGRLKVGIGIKVAGKVEGVIVSLARGEDLRHAKRRAVPFLLWALRTDARSMGGRA